MDAKKSELCCSCVIRSHCNVDHSEWWMV